jgi:hypothetical protein
MFVKQKLIMNKYTQVEKIGKMCKNSKQSLMEIVTYLFEFFEENAKLFAKPKIDAIEELNPFKNVESSKLEALVLSESRKYSQTLH